MQKPNRHFVRICVETLPWKNPVYEFGALEVHEEEDVAYVRDLFPEKGLKYVGCDMRPGPGVDQVQNLHGLDIPDNSVGTIVCLDTLEHVEYPRKAVSEMHRVLKPNGVLIMSSVFNFPIHGYPNDYWRFTPEAFKSLLKDFKHQRVFKYGKTEKRPLVVIGVGFKGDTGDLSEFEFKADKWERFYSSIGQETKIRRDAGTL